MKISKSCIFALFCLSIVGSIPALTQPKELKNCVGVYEFYGNPAPAGRGPALKPRFFIGGKINMVNCFKNSRMVNPAPIQEHLNSGRYSTTDERMIRTTTVQLGLKQPYFAHGGI